MGFLGCGFGLVRDGFGIGRHECWVVFLVLGRDNLGLRRVRSGFWAWRVALGHVGLGLVVGGVVRRLGELIWGCFGAW